MYMYSSSQYKKISYSLSSRFQTFTSQKFCYCRGFTSFLEVMIQNPLLVIVTVDHCSLTQWAFFLESPTRYAGLVSS